MALYEASHVPLLFDGELASFNIGVNGAASYDPMLPGAVETACAAHPKFSCVTNGR